MAKKKKEINFSDQFKTKRAVGIFAIIALIFGYLFIMQSTITGNVILNQEYSLNLLTIVGVSLILCSIILGMYSLKKLKIDEK